MSSDALLKFTELAFQYGPFFFAILFVLGVSRWSYKVFTETSRRTDPPAGKKDLGAARAVFVGSFIVGIVLVGAAVVWWLGYRPRVFVFRGEIRDLQEYELVASESMYFRPEPKQTIDEILLRNEHFVVIQTHPFKKGEWFDFDFSKGRAKRNRLRIPYDPSDDYPKFTVQWDDKAQANVLRREVSADARFTLPFTNQVVHAASVQDIVSQRKVAATSPGCGGSSQGSGPKLFIAVLQDSRSDVGNKIVALERLNQLSTSALEDCFRVVNRPEPLLATILDLTRHSDKELSYRANELVKKIDFDSYLVRQLQSPDTDMRRSAERVLLKLDSTVAKQILGRVPKQRSAELVAKLGSQSNTQQLMPTASPQGDRYYVKATWDPRNSSTVDCLTKLFNRELTSNRTLDQERSLMKTRGERLVYWYDKAWSTYITKEIRSCGGSATFVHAPSVSKPDRSKAPPPREDGS